MPLLSSSDTDEDTHDEEDDEEVGDQIEVDTVVPYRDSDSESEPEQLRIVSDFELLSGSHDEESAVVATLAFSYVRGRGAGTLWFGIGESKRSHRVMTACPIIGQAGGGAVTDKQRRQSPQLQTCQAGLGAEDAPEPLGHPSLGSDPHRQGSKSQNTTQTVFD